MKNKWEEKYNSILEKFKNGDHPFKDIFKGVKKKRKRDNPWSNGCTHLGHNPPTHLYIPPGEIVIHTCPGCNQSIPMSGPNITF